MSSDVRLVRLGDLLEITSSKRVHMADYVASGIPFYRSKEVIERSKGNRISTELFIAPTQFESIKQKFGSPSDGDILLTSVGTLGVPYVVNRDGDFYFKDGNLTWMRNFTVAISPQFLYYWLTSPGTQQKLDEVSIGSTQKALTISALKALEIPLPPRSIQDGIVEILGAISDRITLLRETNTTLEAIAQALFKSWFVDFDPVHAKMQGRAPEGMDEATAALFPDSFEESELGPVPKGWHIGRLDDLLVLQRGFDLPAQDRTPGDFPIIAASGPSGSHHKAMVKGPGVVTGRSGVLGRVFLELEDFWPLNTTLWVKEFKAATPCYAYEVLRLLDFKSFNAGSAVPSLNRNHIHGLPYLVPTRACLDTFEAIASQIHKRCRLNEKQAQSLEDIRDALLPRLISGQLISEHAIKEISNECT
jgi:type I restriction enzyme S subunit